MKIEIKNRWSGEVIFAHDAEENSVLVTVEAAIAVDINLRGADLGGANLCGANLRGADLGGADLCSADLRDADLGGANLCGANLRGADLGGADLCGADLRDADLRDADLCSADLRDADLRDADLGGANIDFSYGWRFACICSRFKISVKFAHQVLAHLCSCESDDPEFSEIREKMLPYALKSNRAGDLGLKASCDAVEAAQ